MRGLVLAAFAAVGTCGCTQSQPPEVALQAQQPCPPVAQPLTWAGPAPDLSAPVTLEVEVRLPPGRPAIDLENYFRPLGFGVQVRELPGRPPLVAVIASKTGQFSLAAVNSIAAGASRHSACSVGSSLSIQQVTRGS